MYPLQIHAHLGCSGGASCWNERNEVRMELSDTRSPLGTCQM